MGWINMTRLSKILLLIIGISLIILTLTSCGASYHLQQAKRHLLIAQSKGAKINSDTVYITKEIYIPGNEIVVNANETIDSAKFDSFIKKYDSLIRLGGLVKGIDLQTGYLYDPNKESSGLFISEAKGTSVTLAVTQMRKQLSKAFTKDSIYYFKVDSITDVVITSKQGIITVKVDRAKTTIKSKQAVSVTQNIKSGRIPNWWIIVGIIVLILIVLVLVKGK